MINKIGIIGRTAYGTDLCDGQTVKTRVLAEELQRKYPTAKMYFVDTYNYKKHPIRLLFNLLKCLKNSQAVFILLSRNGMRVIFPIVNFLNFFFRKPIIHDCIGGSLDELCKKYSGIKKQIKRFTLNWVESEKLTERLKALGVGNVEYLPNFKRLEQLDEADLSVYKQKQFKFCTFSRVNEAKGIGRAAEAVIKINKEEKQNIACLDVYGPIEENYDVKLNEYIKESNGAIAYKGVADYSESVRILKEYYALLFPTTHFGEGFPGTIIDAFSAGVPVIATDWNLNSEIIKHKFTGFLYDWKNEEALEMWMRYIIENPEKQYEMQKNCIKEAKKYSPDVVMQVIDKKLCELVK